MPPPTTTTSACMSRLGRPNRGPLSSQYGVLLSIRGSFIFLSRVLRPVAVNFHACTTRKSSRDREGDPRASRGRIYNYRLGLRANWEQVFDEAARLDKPSRSTLIPTGRT